jgi:hypothetical protein
MSRRCEHLFTFTCIEIPFQSADTVDEKFAVQVIDLVLQGDSQETLCFNLDFLFIFNESRNLYPGGPTHLGGKIHDACSLLPEISPGPGDGGIDQLVKVFMRVSRIDVQDNDAMERPDD